MTLGDAIKQNFLWFVVLIGIGILLMQGCWNKRHQDATTITVHKDTTWVVKNDTVRLLPELVGVLPPDTIEINNPIYLPDTNYIRLKAQYEALVNQHLSSNISKRTYYSDSSSVEVTDTVTKNQIAGRSAVFNLKYPIIKETTTITTVTPPRTQLYLGGGVSGTKESIVNTFDAGILLKTKQDQIYSISGTLDRNGNVGARAGAYFKIRLRK